MFAIEFNDGCPIHVCLCGFARCQICLFTCVGQTFCLMSLFLQVYASTSRDNLLAAVRDVLQTEVRPLLFVLNEGLNLNFKVWIIIIEIKILSAFICLSYLMGLNRSE